VLCPYVVDTGMFAGAFEATWRTRLVKRVFPFLSSEAVAKAVVYTAERRVSVTKAVPWFFGPLINVVRCLPSPLYEIALGMMGGAEGMHSFVGHHHRKAE